MSTGLSTAFITLFEAEVKQAYQGDAVLRNAVRMRTNVEGSTVKFPKIGKGTAQVRTPQTDVVPLNTSFSTVTATMTDYIAAEYSDIFDQQKVNFDERQELAQVVGKAIARREDQIIIDVMEAASPGATIANTVVTSGSAAASDLSIGKIEVINLKELVVQCVDKAISVLEVQQEGKKRLSIQDFLIGSNIKSGDHFS